MRLFKSADFYQGLKEHLLRFYFAKEEEIQTMQNLKLQQTVKQAQQDIDFYKRVFLKHNFDACAFKGLEQLGQIPYLEQTDFFARTKEERSRKEVSCIKLRSSGTNGIPKDVYLSGFDFANTRRIAYLRMLFINGFKLAYKNLFLRSANIAYSVQPKWFWKLGLMREKEINISLALSEQADVFNAYQPEVFNCLTSDGVLLADFIKAQSKIKHKAKVVFTTGEVYSAKDRQQIVDMLGHKIIDFYASTEAGIIAWQCTKNQGYHINADQLYVEIIDGQRVCAEGESGEVVLTTLAARCSPLIRYRTGDSAVLEQGKCKCGSNFPRLSQIQGRNNDFLIATTGQKISPYLMMSTMDVIEELEKYQIIQLSADLIKVHVKVLGVPDNQISNKVVLGCKKILGNNMRIEISSDFVSKSGNKQQTIINKITDAN